LVCFQILFHVWYSYFLYFQFPPPQFKLHLLPTHCLNLWLLIPTVQIPDNLDLWWPLTSNIWELNSSQKILHLTLLSFNPFSCLWPCDLLNDFWPLNWPWNDIWPPEMTEETSDYMGNIVTENDKGFIERKARNRMVAEGYKYQLISDKQDSETLGKLSANV